MTDLSGRTAVVTGGGSGLGAAIARSLHAAGAHVVVVGRDAAKLDRVAADLGSRARGISCDVSDPASVDALREQLAGTDVSILVNNAGIPGPVAALTDIDVADWDEVFAVNVRGTFLLCKALLPGMVERGDGDVINLSLIHI